MTSLRTNNFGVTLAGIIACALGVLVAARPAAQGAVWISEFMASNSSTLTDEDGESSDWIELYNAAGTPVDLTGWHLTDNAGNLKKWTLPATNLPPFSYLVVFASGKNRTIPGGELHINFQLSREGEYLALVEPDGVTIAHEFAPAFPPQRANISYGLEFETLVTPLIATGATARVLVPTNGELGLSWTARTFDDSAWWVTNTPVGFALGKCPRFFAHTFFARCSRGGQRDPSPGRAMPKRSVHGFGGVC